MAYASSYQKQCHYGAIALFDIGNSRVYGGRLATLQSSLDWDLLISLDPHDSSAFPGPLFGKNTWAEKMLPKELFEFTGMPVMQIRWPDGGTVPITREWWKMLLETLRDIPIPEGKEKAKVAIGCFGGHGRTGTALSCMVGLTQLVEPDGDPVKWLRDHYCDEAVETEGQIEYIEKITGKKVKEVPSLNFGYGGYTISKTDTTATTKGSKKNSLTGACLSTHFCSTCPNDQRCEDCPMREPDTVVDEKLAGWDHVRGDPNDTTGRL